LIYNQQVQQFMETTMKKFFKRLIEARQRQANARIAEMHLWRMSDRELNDLGIGRGDIKRVVHEGVK
jgi:uncharacterized protein YjiS (DUF1127 family)